jgi:putative transposase
MARLVRVSPVDILQHLILRCNNRQVCFGNEVDMRAYLHWLKLFSKKSQVDIHAWVLMTNHAIKRGQYPLIEKLSTTNMPRKARFFISKIPVHMVIRGNSRKTIFAEQEDYQFYLQWLLERSGELDCEIDIIPI